MIRRLIGGYIAPFKDENGKVVANSVAKLEKITLGGVEQWFTIRGRNKDLPILFFLHGGPGSPQTGAQQKYNAILENYYLVVNWDQRGSGKSFHSGVSKESMNLEQLILDAYELACYLMYTYNRKKIFVMGQSVGAIIGLYFASRFPEIIDAYIGINQPVNRKVEEKLSYEFTLETARKKNNKKAIKQLNQIGFPENGTYKSFKDMVIQRTWVTKFKGVTHKKNAAFINIHYLLSTHLTFKEKLNFMKGFGFSATHLWDEITAMNLFHSVPEVKIPVYIFAGKYDQIVNVDLIEEYFNLLKAPSKKLYIFENSGHYACFEEGDRFNNIMINEVWFENSEKNNNQWVEDIS